jgi:Neuraminidase (sialidase)
VYFLGIQLDLRGDLVNPPSAILASRSHDGGRTWTRPVTVSAFEPVNDTGAITASPTRGARVRGLG